MGLLGVGGDCVVQYCRLELFLATLEVKEKKLAKAFIGIGLPGSGKTTYLRQFATDIGAIYISADDIRAEWCGNAQQQRYNGQVWLEVHRRARKALMAGQDVVIDGVHTKQTDRAATIRACNSAESVVGIWCQAPFGVCMARNRSRERVVPTYAMKRMRGQLYSNPPSKREGFARIDKIQTAG